MKLQYKHTMYACFIGYIVQAIVNNFAPLLFLTFQSEYGISLDRIALLTGMNFGIQLIVDLLSARFADRIGYRRCVLTAHICSAAGLILLTILPEILPDAYLGICLSVAVYAVGGGLIEVLISPIMQACPGDEKEMAMSLLHSFYCWGQVGVVLLSTLFFAVFGIENWKILAWLWTLVPIANGLLFLWVPIGSLLEEGDPGLSMRELAQTGIFWVFMLLMACAGSCEQAVSQWASAYAESSLGVPKTIGDLAGPLLFAVTMGSARLFYGKFGEKIDLQRFMAVSGILCAVSYLLIGISGQWSYAAPAWAVVGFAGCALCGLSVGILWPGTFSLGAVGIPRGGTAMFALFALAGDLGCASGPTFVGLMADQFGGRLNLGILSALIFPALLLAGLGMLRHFLAREKKTEKIKENEER